MGAWNFTAGLFLCLVLNNIQDLETLPNGNSSLESQRKISPDSRQFFEDREDRINRQFYECVGNWKARIGDPCISDGERLAELTRLGKVYKGNVPRSKYKATFEGDVEPSKCDKFKKDLTKNCDKEIEARDEYFRIQNIRFHPTFPTTRTPRRVSYRPRSNTTGGNVTLTGTGSHNTTSSVSDPGQQFQYITFMANIIFVLTDN